MNATQAPSYIEGANVLGFGFDIFGKLEVESRLSPMFSIDWEAAQTHLIDINPEDPYEVLIPANVIYAGGISEQEATTRTFKGREEYQEEIAAHASVEGVYGAFRGQFSASFGMATEADRQYQYAAVKMYSRYWSLDLVSKGADGLLPEVSNGALYADMPATFDPSDAENVAAFFRFFNRYGLYYITRVDVGCRLFYNILIKSSYAYSETEIASKASAEYNAVFKSAKGEAEAEWKKVGKTYSEQRTAEAQAKGGSVSLGVAFPEYGQVFNQQFEAWVESTYRTPAVVEFTLEPISRVFPDDKQLAVEAAIEAYVEQQIFVESKTGSCTLFLGGVPKAGADPGEERQLGFLLAAFERETENLVFTQEYRIAESEMTTGYGAYYDQALADITAAIAATGQPESSFVVAFSTYAMFGHCYPTQGFRDFLYDCGAGDGLLSWESLKYRSVSLSDSSANMVHCNYALVGAPGLGKYQGEESFNQATDTETWNKKEDWNAKPAAVVEQGLVLADLAEATEIVAARRAA